MDKENETLLIETKKTQADNKKHQSIKQTLKDQREEDETKHVVYVCFTVQKVKRIHIKKERKKEEKRRVNERERG